MFEYTNVMPARAYVWLNLSVRHLFVARASMIQVLKEYAWVDKWWATTLAPIWNPIRSSRVGVAAVLRRAPQRQRRQVRRQLLALHDAEAVHVRHLTVRATQQGALVARDVGRGVGRHPQVGPLQRDANESVGATSDAQEMRRDGPDASIVSRSLRVRVVLGTVVALSHACARRCE